MPLTCDICEDFCEKEIIVVKIPIPNQNAFINLTICRTCLDSLRKVLVEGKEKKRNKGAITILSKEDTHEDIPSNAYV